jgi:hypothetical protein
MPALVDAYSSGAMNGVTRKHPNGHTNSTNAQTNGDVNGDSNGNTSRSIGFSEPIAICGMAIRLPDGIHDAKDF